MFLILLALSVLTISSAQPNGIVPQNVITVPPNCPEGQELINGECRDIWRSGVTTPLPFIETNEDALPMNVITVPTNCPPGQQLVNGQCRDIWRGGILGESKLFEKLLQNQWSKSAHDRYFRQAENENGLDMDMSDPLRNIISVPTQCPDGFRPDALGICRPIL